MTLHWDVLQAVLPSLCGQKRVVAMPNPDFLYNSRSVQIPVLVCTAGDILLLRLTYAQQLDRSSTIGRFGNQTTLRL
ncbi:MAG: hypothetical protein ACM65L_15650 [Microcoleus sp.]